MNLPTIAEMTAFASADGQQYLVNLIHKAQTEKGSKWLEYLQKEYPLPMYFIDLAMNYNSADAYSKVARDYPLAAYFETEIIDFHQKLKIEIERKRF